jgi:hypothetical protein
MPKAPVSLASHLFPTKCPCSTSGSDDDFYLLDTGLVVLQTTNSVFNLSLYDTITPEVGNQHLPAVLL